MVEPANPLSKAAKGQLNKLYKELQAAPVPGWKAELVGDDIGNWIVTLDGPEGSYFEGGKFQVEFDFQTGFPFKPPQIRRGPSGWAYIPRCARSINSAVRPALVLHRAPPLQS